MEFRWNNWNLDHISEHNIAPQEAEYVLENPGKGYPTVVGSGKYLVRGQTAGGDFIQVAFVYDPDGTVFVIHSRPLTENEKKAFKKRR